VLVSSLHACSLLWPKSDRDSDPGAFTAALLAVLNVASDVWFVISIAGNSDLMSAMQASVALIVIPCMINLFATISIIVGESKKSSKWSEANKGSIFIVGFLGIFNVDSVSILLSQSFGMNAPFTPDTQNKIKMYGLVGTLLEDMPQIVIQWVVAEMLLGYWTVPMAVAFCLSGVSLIFAVLRRAFSISYFSATTDRSSNSGAQWSAVPGGPASPGVPWSAMPNSPNTGNQFVTMNVHPKPIGGYDPTGGYGSPIMEMPLQSQQTTNGPSTMQSLPANAGTSGVPLKDGQFYLQKATVSV